MRPRQPPQPVRLGNLSASVVRDRGQDARGRWYWRVRETGGRRAYRWQGRATPDEMGIIVSTIVVHGDAAPAEARLEECSTLRDVLELWIGSKATQPISGETLHAYRAAARHLVLTIGDIPVTSCRAAAGVHVQARLFPERGAAGASSTVRREVDNLRSAWAWAVDEELVEGPGPRNVRVPDRGRVYSHATPTPDQTARVQAWLDGRRRARWVADAHALLDATGARIGEINALRGVDVDLEQLVVHLHGRVTVCGVARTGKTGTRTVPIAPTIADRLRPLLPEAPEDRIWPVTPSVFGSRFREVLDAACRAVGIPRYPPNGLRRAMDDRLMAGDPSVLARWQGHSAELAIRVYRTVRDEALVEAARKHGVSGHSTGAQSPGSTNRDQRSTEEIT